ncbi:hypothetical protein CEUSTIGMA_g6058.t1 [Chlamydomonas eustigma]|uniref:Uncharacterized protein n=1 Tax=Chlamydomonas eustigma TaxID=1157962 RepID=A0A250X6S5_9CHLO|nr:hypothetical protein CEUSTIGMA_g6058.t1 [Chlamydomonas eustigma]|eukprot:GAX78619.1 hypothetical protein CEUSTIGMA_g6058.t1 [Chlamydomonas eustigma]
MSSPETLNPPSASSQNLPLHPTQERSSRAHFIDRSQHREWNFLQGVGPSSSDMYYAEEKKGFKPGWQSRRPQAAIQQDKERLENETKKEGRITVTKTLKTERLTEWQNYSNFNPITGASKVGSDWQPSSEPWQHWKQGVRPTSKISTLNPKPEYEQQRAVALNEVYNMRKERLASNGLMQKPKGGSMADVLNWNM